MRSRFSIMPRRTFELLFAILLLGACFVVRGQTSLEYEIKAAYLYKFIAMTDWPAGSLPPEGQEITLGVYGANPFGLALTPLDGKVVKGRTLRVREVSSIEELRKCQAVFISPSERAKSPELIRELQNSNILTMSEMPGFAQGGGMINFIVERNRIRFQINPQAAHRAGLTVSSEVLKLARIVGR